MLPSQSLRGTRWETHKALFQEALKASQLLDSVPAIHDADAPGPFIRSTSAGRDPRAASTPVDLSSILVGTRFSRRSREPSSSATKGLSPGPASAPRPLAPGGARELIRELLG